MYYVFFMYINIEKVVTVFFPRQYTVKKQHVSTKKNKIKNNCKHISANVFPNNGTLLTSKPLSSVNTF